MNCHKCSKENAKIHFANTNVYLCSECGEHIVYYPENCKHDPCFCSCNLIECFFDPFTDRWIVNLPGYASVKFADKQDALNCIAMNNNGYIIESRNCQ